MKEMRWELVICAALVGCAGQAAPPSAHARNRKAPATSETLVNEVPGRLSLAEIRRVALAKKGEFRACYENEAGTDPTLQGLEGEIVLSWEILADGSVSAPMVGRSTLDNVPLEECMLRLVRGWHFPASESQTIVEAVPFHFPL